MNEYKLTFTMMIEDLDDPVARKQAKAIVDALSKFVSDAEVKLQQVHQNKPPAGRPNGLGANF